MPTELASILDGTYTISKSTQILALIFVRNHKSWEDDEVAQAALWPEVAKMLWRGVLEYVARQKYLFTQPAPRGYDQEVFAHTVMVPAPSWEEEV